MSGIVDRVAKAIWGAEWNEELVRFEDTSETNQNALRIQARAAIEAMKDPNEDMIFEGLQAMVRLIEQYHDHRVAVNEPQKFMCLGAIMRNGQEISVAYDAMISAALADNQPA